MRALPLFLALLGLVTLSACSASGVERAPAPDLQFDGTVTYTDLEGGAWVVAGDDGTTYEPVNLAEEYHAEGLRVRVEAARREDLGSFLMAGPIIEIIRIERL